jgi:nucleoside-diphosphate-sugar epimerase
MMEIRGRRFLVTGGTGFLGSALVRGLVAQGGIVRSLDDDSRGGKHRLADIADRVELVTGDVRDSQAVARAVKGVDCVCHLAYLNGTEFFYSKPELVLEIGVKGMMNVLDACIAHGVKDLVLASSSEVYQTPPKIPTPEEVPLSVPDVMNPRYSYGGGKIISELLAVNYGRTRFDRVAIFRPHNAYGPDMGREHVIPQLSLRVADLADKQPSGAIQLPIQGSGEETRAFVYVDDMAEGMLRVVERGAHLGVYHLGTTDEVTMKDLAIAIGRAVGRDVVVVPGALQPGGTPRRCPDISKARGLGYEPRVPLASGLERTVAWYRANR